MNIIKSGKFTWIDFLDPQPGDITYLQENYNIHPLAIEELMTPTYQPKAVQYDKCLFLSVHTPLFDAALRTTYPGELDIILTKDTLITAHKHDIYQLREFHEKLARSKGSQRLYFAKTPAHLLYHVLEILLNSCFPKLHHISENLDYIETQVFSGHEKEMVTEISIVKRDILNFRRTLKPQRSILDSLTQRDHPFIPDDLTVYFQDLIGTNIRVWNILESTKETIEALEATNNSLLSNKLDMTMKVLTIFNAVLLPMSAYSNMLAMSADIPFGHSPHAFWIHVGIMFVISMATMVVFKARKWF
ncbi:MAG: magnesium transporter CorA family protein [Candidatus Moranbacteria bacterium]|nr:magnesium transporter CorA family protein [Candidatus Moranbacteria bacterium]NTW45739.1 magnesium transporter CorA family protein [Candidatus Moranbacteria bacterium]